MLVTILVSNTRYLTEAASKKRFILTHRPKSATHLGGKGIVVWYEDSMDKDIRERNTSVFLED